jgi:hypothetical protein
MGHDSKTDPIWLSEHRNRKQNHTWDHRPGLSVGKAQRGRFGTVGASLSRSHLRNRRGFSCHKRMAVAALVPGRLVVPDRNTVLMLVNYCAQFTGRASQ